MKKGKERNEEENIHLANDKAHPLGDGPCPGELHLTNRKEDRIEDREDCEIQAKKGSFYRRPGKVCLPLTQTKIERRKRKMKKKKKEKRAILLASQVTK